MEAFNNRPEALPTAYLGNLHPQTVQSDFDHPQTGLFKGLKIEKIRLKLDKDSDTPKPGYGFAEFSDQDSLQKAVKLNGALVCGQKVVIEEKKPGKSKGGFHHQGSGAPHRSSGRSDFPGFNNNRQNSSGTGGFSRSSRPLPDLPPFTVFVGDLPEEATEEDLFTMFESLDIKSARLVINKETGSHKGHGYVEFNTRESLSQALTLNGAVWMEKQIKVAVHEKRGPANGGGMGPAPTGSGRFPRSGDQPQQHSFRKPSSKPAEDLDLPIDDKDRPKLNLQKKSEGGSAKSLTEQSQKTSSKPSPFGNAKPVDTAAKLLELEKKKAAATPAPPAAADSTEKNEQAQSDQ